MIGKTLLLTTSSSLRRCLCSSSNKVSSYYYCCRINSPGCIISHNNSTALERVVIPVQQQQQQQQQRSYYSSNKNNNSSSSSSSNNYDPIFQLSSSNLRFGPEATREVGNDLINIYKCKSVIVFTDTTIRNLSCFQILLDSLECNNIQYKIYDNVRIEPNDISFKHAIDYLSKQNTSNYDGIIAMGGGSVIDTAKAANLYACYPPEHDFYDYVNPPRGKGIPVPGEVKPLIAIPTTSGTGSETTGVAIFDDTITKSKTGIANRHIEPILGIVDPINTASQPINVTTYTGLDVLCHAIESYTALPSTKRTPRPQSSIYRPTYQGSNPISDIWALYAIQNVAKTLPIVIQDTSNINARLQMLLSSSAAGMGFGNAGVHLCHGMSYPISSQVRNYKGYEKADHPLIPHGLSVIVNAPAVFTFTGIADPDRHATCAKILQQARLGTTTTNYTNKTSYNDSGAWLADEIREFCTIVNVQTGLKQFQCYTDNDIPMLVDGTIQQHRVTKISPRPVQRSDLEELFRIALSE